MKIELEVTPEQIKSALEHRIRVACSEQIIGHEG